MLTRDEYVEKKKGQLDDWNAEMGVLEAAILKDKQTAKKNIRAQMELLRVKREAAEKQLGSIKLATQDTWHHLKVETDNVWLALKDSMTEFRSHFS
jgi:hypothetical protein